MSTNQVNFEDQVDFFNNCTKSILNALALENSLNSYNIVQKKKKEIKALLMAKLRVYF